MVKGLGLDPWDTSPTLEGTWYLVLPLKCSLRHAVKMCSPLLGKCAVNMAKGLGLDPWDTTHLEVHILEVYFQTITSTHVQFELQCENVQSKW